MAPTILIHVAPRQRRNSGIAQASGLMGAGLGTMGPGNKVQRRPARLRYRVCRHRVRDLPGLILDITCNPVPYYRTCSQNGPLVTRSRLDSELQGGYTDRDQSDTNVPVCVDAAKLTALFVGELCRKCFASATDAVNFLRRHDGQEILVGTEPSCAHKAHGFRRAFQLSTTVMGTEVPTPTPTVIRNRRPWSATA